MAIRQTGCALEHASAALQNKIVNWCSDHRRHHKKLDTDDDPYSIKEGFFHAHMGWILEQKEFAVKVFQI